LQALETQPPARKPPRSLPDARQDLAARIEIAQSIRKRLKREPTAGELPDIFYNHLQTKSEPLDQVFGGK
jgi:hypothetical protein